MDPNENLAEQRRIAERILANHHTADDCERLAELVTALDDWLMSGGFLPAHWKGR